MYKTLRVARKVSPNLGFTSDVVTISPAAHNYVFHSSVLNQLLTLAQLVIIEVGYQSGKP